MAANHVVSSWLDFVGEKYGRDYSRAPCGGAQPGPVLIFSVQPGVFAARSHGFFRAGQLPRHAALRMKTGEAPSGSP